MTQRSTHRGTLARRLQGVSELSYQQALAVVTTEAEEGRLLDEHTASPDGDVPSAKRVPLPDDVLDGHERHICIVTDRPAAALGPLVDRAAEQADDVTVIDAYRPAASTIVAEAHVDNVPEALAELEGARRPDREYWRRLLFSAVQRQLEADGPGGTIAELLDRTSGISHDESDTLDAARTALIGTALARCHIVDELADDPDGVTIVSAPGRATVAAALSNVVRTLDLHGTSPRRFVVVAADDAASLPAARDLLARARASNVSVLLLDRDTPATKYLGNVGRTVTLCPLPPADARGTDAPGSRAGQRA